MSLTLISDVTPIVNSFSRLGIDILHIDDGRIFRYPERFALAILGTTMWTIAMLNFTWVYYNNVDQMVAAMAIIVQLFLSIAKIVLFLLQGERFLQLNARSEALVRQVNSNEERELWNATNRQVLIITWSYSSACWTTVTICVLVPLLRLLYNYLRYDEVVMTLPLPGIFPYDFTQPHNFILTNIFSVLLVYFAVNSIVAVDGLFGWFVYNISGHLQILHLKLTQLVHTRTVEESVQFYREFKQFIEYHRHIITIAVEFDGVFGLIIFAEVTCSCLQICFLVYQVAFTTDPTNLPFICALMGSIIIQLMIYCFGGEKLKNDCDFICEEIYLLTPWQQMPKTLRQLFIFPLMRSQRVLTLTGYFFTADRSLLVWIFRTAGSFTALLVAMKEKQ